MLRFISAILTTLFFSNAFAQSYGFDDHKPVYWDGVPPAAFPVHGVDVSRYQGSPNWHQLRSEGVSFAYLKATEGSDVLDTSFGYNWNRTLEAGITRGAYHFYYFCSSPEEQAAWFIQNVPRQKGSLPPVIDVETNPNSRSCLHRPKPDEAIDVISRLANILEEHYGQRPIIYTDKTHFYEFQMYRLRGLEFWLRSTAQVPSSVFGNQPWVFWQYTGTGQIPGVRGKIDVNAFNGSAEKWRAWTSRRLVK